MPHGVAVIGLGVMGQRMLGNMAVHDLFEVRSLWDPDARACAETKARYFGERIGVPYGEPLLHVGPLPFHDPLLSF